jgi:hypothetical protein
MRHAVVVALLLLLMAPAMAQKPVSLTRYMREHRLNVDVTKYSWGYRATFRGRQFEIRGGSTGGLIHTPDGMGKTPTAALNHLVEQIRGKAVLFDAYSAREEGRVPESFERNTFARLPAGARVLH